MELPSSEVATGKTIFGVDAIVINANLKPDDKLYWLSYEIHNLAQKEKALALTNQAYEGKIGRELLAKNVERIEFETSINNYKFIKNIFAQGCWSDVKNKADFLLDKILTQISFDQWWGPKIKLTPKINDCNGIISPNPSSANYTLFLKVLFD